MSIYTRRGDHGETSLADGSRVRKDCARVDAYGTIDEANSVLGLARAATSDPLLADVLRFAQQRLFNCSAALAAPGGPTASTPAIAEADIAALEHAIDHFDAVTGPPAGFVLEGGSELAARLHVTRAILRRAERRAVTLSAAEPVDVHVLSFLNRLSDTMFAAARYANAQAGFPEEPWDRAAPRPDFSA